MLDLVRGILEEFVEAERLAKPQGREVKYDRALDALLDPESARAEYRAKHEQAGTCRSCKLAAKPGRKYCPDHLRKASERATRSLKERRSHA
jgi:hypothetical protein